MKDIEKTSLGLVNEVILKTVKNVGHWWLKPVILVTQEAEIRRIAF
jgi:hypothetical protein